MIQVKNGKSILEIKNLNKKIDGETVNELYEQQLEHQKFKIERK